MKKYLLAFFYFTCSIFAQYGTTLFPNDEIFFVTQNSSSPTKTIVYSGTAQQTVFGTNYNESIFYITTGNSNLEYSITGESGSRLDRWYGWDFINSAESQYPSTRVFGYGKYLITTDDASSDYFYIDYRDCNYTNAYTSGRDFWIKYDDNSNHFFYGTNPVNITNGWTQISNGASLNFWDIKGITRSIASFNPNPSNLSATNQSSHPYLQWSHSGLSGGTYIFEIWRKFSGQGFQKIAEIFSKNYTDNELGIDTNPDLLVIYKVRAKIDDLVSDYSNSVSIYYRYLLKNNEDCVIFETPNAYFFSSNYPNPFNPSTNISYSIRANNFVSLKVYNSIGKEVAELVNEIQGAGNYTIPFDGRNLSSGVYY